MMPQFTGAKTWFNRRSSVDFLDRIDKIIRISEGKNLIRNSDTFVYFSIPPSHRQEKLFQASSKAANRKPRVVIRSSAKPNVSITPS